MAEPLRAGPGEDEDEAYEELQVDLTPTIPYMQVCFIRGASEGLIDIAERTCVVDSYAGLLTHTSLGGLVWPKQSARTLLRKQHRHSQKAEG